MTSQFGTTADGIFFQNYFYFDVCGTDQFRFKTADVGWVLVHQKASRVSSNVDHNSKVSVIMAQLHVLANMKAKIEKVAAELQEIQNGK